jgi:hypothetical protein
VAPQAGSVETDIQRGLARMIAGRRKLLELRDSRSGQVSRLRLYLQAQFGSFVSSVDPVTGTRIVDLLAEGSISKGDIALTVVFFDGTKLRIGVDAVGKFDFATTPPELASELGTILDIDVAEDLGQAALMFSERHGKPGARRSLDARELVERMIAHALAAVETDIEPANVPVAAAPVG